MNMFKFEFKRLIKSGLIWSLVCSAIVIMFIGMFPSMESIGIQDIVGAKLDAFPEGMLQAFNISGIVDFSDISYYSAYVLQYIVMAGAVYGAILGISSLSKEEAEGTIEFLYSKPISRSKIVTAKLLASVLIYYIFVMIVGIVAMVMVAVVIDSNKALSDVFMDIKSIFIGMTFIGCIFMAIGFLLSVFIKSSKQAVTIAISVFFSTYVLGVLSKLSDKLSNIIYLSPFDYGNPMDVIKNGFETKYIITGMCIMIISIICTYVIYNKKDYNI